MARDSFLTAAALFGAVNQDHLFEGALKTTRGHFPSRSHGDGGKTAVNENWIGLFRS